MNEKIKIIVGIAALVVIIGAAAFAYENLSDKYASNELGFVSDGVDSINTAEPADPTESTDPIESTESTEPADTSAPQTEADVDVQYEAEAAAGDNTQEDGQDNSQDDGNGTNPDDEPPYDNEEPVEIAAPDFTVVDIDGNETKLSDFFGKPIVVNFWASWCPPCINELPDFNNVYGDFKDDVVFMMVNLADGQRETVSSGSKYISDKGFDFPVYYDTTGETAYVYGYSSIPVSLFIDINGNVIAAHQGQLNEQLIRKGISLIYSASE